MERAVGNRVRYVEMRNAPHSIILAGLLIGLRKEVEEAVSVANGFFAACSWQSRSKEWPKLGIVHLPS